MDAGGLCAPRMMADLLTQLPLHPTRRTDWRATDWFKGLSPPWQPKNDFQVAFLIMKSKSKPKIRSGEFATKNVERAN